MKPLLARVGALVLAVGLVVGALVVRGRLDGDDGGPSILSPQEVAFSCSRGLASVCDGVEEALPDAEVVVRRVLDQLTDVATTPALVPASWADVEDERRRSAGEEPLARSDVLASTPVLLVAFADRAELLAAACDVPVEQLTWRCVGEHAGTEWSTLGGAQNWGTVRLGHGSPDSATGLLATASVVASRTGTPFALNDLQDQEVAAWWRAVERAVQSHTPATGTHLTGMVVRGPSVANVATATEAEAAQLQLDTTYGQILVVAAEPVFWHDLVVVGLDEDAVEAASAALDGGPGRDALAAAGWRTDGAAPAGSPLPATPPRVERPDGGVLTAVRTQFVLVAG